MTLRHRASACANHAIFATIADQDGQYQPCLPPSQRLLAHPHSSSLNSVPADASAAIAALTSPQRSKSSNPHRPPPQPRGFVHGRFPYAGPCPDARPVMAGIRKPSPSPSISNVAIVPETRRYRPSAVAFQGRLADQAGGARLPPWRNTMAFAGRISSNACAKGVLVHTAMSPISRILAVARFGESSRLPFLAPNCLASSARVFKKLRIPLSKILVNGRFCVVH